MGAFCQAARAWVLVALIVAIATVTPDIPMVGERTGANQLWPVAPTRLGAFRGTHGRQGSGSVTGNRGGAGPPQSSWSGGPGRVGSAPSRSRSRPAGEPPAGHRDQPRRARHWRR